MSYREFHSSRTPKKTQTDTYNISFIEKNLVLKYNLFLEEIGSEKLTPIEITLRGTASISQALKTFDETYNEKVDHYMIFNESIAEQKDLLLKISNCSSTFCRLRAG
jgi:hypothetical protein